MGEWYPMRGFYSYRHHVPRRMLVRVILLVFAAAVIVLTVIGGGQMRAILTRLATTRVTSTVNRIVSETVNDAVENGTFQYDRMISFEKDNNGAITAVKSNMTEFNRLQAEILKEILGKVSEVSTKELAIPVGTLTGSSLLAGRGPAITVKMQSVGSSAAVLENEFTSAGINQTKHRILLRVDVSVSILLPGFVTATKVSNTVTVAETIIVGDVPDSYTYFHSSDPIVDSAKDRVMNGS